MRIVQRQTYIAPRFGPDDPVFIIAEAGTGHNGDLARGKELIAAAAESGADCVKFQMVYADEIIHPKTGKVPLPGGDIPLYERFKSLEMPTEFYAVLQEEARRRGVAFLCTPFGIRSARELRELGVDLIKIASPELNHVLLLREIAGYNITLLLSTGVSTLGDIEEALSLVGPSALPPLSDRPVTALLHCITAYPAPEEEYNLAVIPFLSGIFGVPAGVSDHSLDAKLVPVTSVASGARIIEKHIRLDKTASGLDDPIALSPGQFREMTRAVRSAEEYCRSRPAGAYPETGRSAHPAPDVPALSSGSAEKPSALLRSLEEEFGRKRVSAVLGDGVKRLAPAEALNYGRSNRSIHARITLRKGDTLTENNTAILRTEKELSPGLHPRWYSTILGKHAARDIDEGEGILWDHLL